MVGRSLKTVKLIEGTKSVWMSDDPGLQRRLEQLLLGVENTPRYKIALMSEENKVIVADFLHEMTYKDNAPPKTKGAYINNLSYLIEDAGKKSLREMTAQDIDLFLQSKRKPAGLDPKQKWIGTHNTRCAIYLHFFKWLAFPELNRQERKKQPRPACVRNVTILQKPEPTNVEANDLWTSEMDRMFLKYCLDKRMCWYHTASDDTSTRPGELLAKRFSDVKIKLHDGKAFGEVEIGRGQKTKGRIVPLIRSLPYFKQLAAENPDPNSYIFRSNRPGFKERNQPVKESSLWNMYDRLKTDYFPALLKRPDVPPEDKDIIEEMLKKPWNPYIRRHTALTEKAKFLNDYNLKLHAGWSKDSKMPKIYTHELGGESSRAILAEMGIMPGEVQMRKAMLEPRYCPKCHEPNKPDTKFCIKDGCGTPLSPEAYFEIKEHDSEQAREIEQLKKEREMDRKNNEKFQQDMLARMDDLAKRAEKGRANSINQEVQQDS